MVYISSNTHTQNKRTHSMLTHWYGVHILKYTYTKQHTHTQQHTHKTTHTHTHTHKNTHTQCARWSWRNMQSSRGSQTYPSGTFCADPCPSHLSAHIWLMSKSLRCEDPSQIINRSFSFSGEVKDSAISPPPFFLLHKRAKTYTPPPPPIHPSTHTSHQKKPLMTNAWQKTMVKSIYYYYVIITIL